MTDNKAGPAQDKTAPYHPELIAIITMILLLLITVLITFHAEFLVRSIGSFTIKTHIPERFVGLIQ